MNQLNNQNKLYGMGNHLISTLNTNVLDNILQDKTPFETMENSQTLPDTLVANFKLLNLTYMSNLITSEDKVTKKEIDIFSKDLFNKFIYNFLLLNKEPKYNFDNEEYIGNMKQEIDFAYFLYNVIMDNELSSSSRKSCLDEANEALNLLDNKQDIKNLEKFIYKIFRGHFRQGHSVNRYIKKLKNIPFFIEDLLNLVRGKYYMKVDAESINILFALLGIITYKKIKSQRIFYLKMLQFKKENEYLFD